jgi:hypothetical protein
MANNLTVCEKSNCSLVSALKVWYTEKVRNIENRTESGEDRGLVSAVAELAECTSSNSCRPTQKSLSPMQKRNRVTSINTWRTRIKENSVLFSIFLTQGD